MEYLKNFFDVINSLTWGWSLIPFLVIFGLFFTLASRFVQFEFFKRMFKILVMKTKSDPNAISGREALLLSIGGRVGGGNVAGVAVAITLGGPGAIFWMWMIALIGMTTSLVECTLAQLFKRSNGDGTYRGGPARSIIFGLGEEYKWLAATYAVCLIAVFALGFNAFQGNTVAGAAQDSLGIGRIWTGILLAILAGFIVFGGIRRIAKTTEIVVPIMAIGYLGMTLIIIVLNLTELPNVIVTIVKSAFGFDQAISGGMGVALAHGLRRGLFSNEAGLGSVPNVAATAKVNHPIEQGITQSLSVFIDTILICSCTAFIILLGDVYVPGAQSIDGVVLTQQSLVSHLGDWTQYFLTGALLLFAFSSIIYNYYLGENALTFLTQSSVAVYALRLGVIAVLFVGAVAPGATAVFFFSDPLMGILAVVNLIALALMFPKCSRVLKDYRDQLKKGIKNPQFDPAKFPELDIDLSAWELDEQLQPKGRREHKASEIPVIQEL